MFGKSEWLKLITSMKLINYFVLISIVYYFLFPQYVIAASFDLSRSKALYFSVISLGFVDKHQGNVFANMQEADYFLKLKQQELNLAKKEKIFASDVENKMAKQEIAASKSNKVLLVNSSAIPSIKIKKEVKPDLVTDTESMKVVITAYSSTPDQTDSSPFVTASGKRVQDGVIAANFLPFGTKVKFPALFGDKEFVVEDRMKSNIKVDIWFLDRQSAKSFGIKRSEMLIISRPEKFKK